MSAVAALRVLAVLASAASADGVAPVALDGDAELGSAVAQALAERGIRVVSSAGTESVQVHVQPDPAGIRLFIYDRNGHAVERIVANAEVAAAVVESWVRDDLARSLLDPHEVSTTGGAEWDQGSFASPCNSNFWADPSWHRFRSSSSRCPFPSHCDCGCRHLLGH